MLAPILLQYRGQQSLVWLRVHNCPTAVPQEEVSLPFTVFDDLANVGCHGINTGKSPFWFLPLYTVQSQLHCLHVQKECNFVTQESSSNARELPSRPQKGWADPFSSCLSSHKDFKFAIAALGS